MRVTVLGGGIAGLSSAWALDKRGHAVTLVEQGPIPNPLSASGDQHRMIRRAYGAADGYARTITEAFAAWNEMWADLGARHQEDCGVLAISQLSGDGAEQFREGLDRTGHPYEQFTPAEAARRYPFLDPATFRYAYLSAEGGVLLCERIARDLGRRLAARGVVLRTQTRVDAVDLDRARVTLATGETLSADALVVAAGAWVLRLCPELASQLAIFRTALAYLAPPADLEAAWREAPAILDIGGASDAWVIPPVDGTGLKFGAEAHKRPSADPELRRVPEPGEGERIRDLFSPPFARIGDYRVRSVVTCAYTFTPDSTFFSLQRGKGVVVAACSGHAYKFGAAIGRRVADAIETGDGVTLGRWLRAEPTPERAS